MRSQSGFPLETPDYTALKNAFASELTLASQEQSSSLHFIKHHLPEKPLLTKGLVQGIVIGGTNYINSVERITNDGSREIIERKTGILPTFSTKQVLMDFLNQQMDGRAEGLGINFAFPLKPTIGPFGALDATFIYGTKEHNFQGLTEPIGQLAASIFDQKFHRRISVSVANDSVCLILAAKEKMDCGIIVGTGLGMSLRQRINGQDAIVNVEPGNFNKFTPFATLEKIDAQSERPTEYLFEKSLSGKYLYEHFNMVIAEFGLSIPPVRTSHELSAISESHTDKDIMDLSRNIITRSATMTTCALAGVYQFLGQPKQMRIIGDGSLFWNGWEYQTTIKNQLQKFGLNENAIMIKRVPDCSINGAIGLVTNT